MKSLIIDDSRAMRRILTSIVKGIGYQVVEAEDGVDGLEKLEADPSIDLVLVDWNMPKMNGLDFVINVRARPQYEKLHMVMVTTETEPARMARALMAGVDEFVMKPFTPSILIDKLKLIGAPMAAK
jgi:two-component system chemotaxis response regulator CheY